MLLSNDVIMTYNWHITYKLMFILGTVAWLHSHSNYVSWMYVMPLAQKKTVKQMQPSLSLIVSMTSEIMEMNKVGTDGEI